jgi:soluble lytic murein transglycosylase
LTVYRRASAAADSSAITAEFARIRVLIRLRSHMRALAELSRFLAAHPEHRLAPAASLLLAELTEEGGRQRQGDSVYRLLVQHWPVNDYASQARMKLAASALRRGNRAEAAQWYLEEDGARGAQQFAARYLLGSLDYRAESPPPDSWVRLARDDSLGYYGFLARTRMGVALPAIRLLPAHPLPAQFSDALEQLDLLDRVGFHTEATVLVGWLVSQARDADAAPELGEELAARGRSLQGIGLGWRAARRTTMNDARVLRAIYPWPFRAAVTTESREFGLDPYLLAALVRQE